MPASFEQQRELIATFRSVARSLLASPEEPVTMKDLDGNLSRGRVRTVTARLVELGFVEERRERLEGSHYAHLAWRLVDEPAHEFLSRIVESEVQTAKFLWPEAEDGEISYGGMTLEETSAAMETFQMPEDETPPATEAGSVQDPVALVAEVLEGFNDRIAAMERRTEEAGAKLDLVVGGMGELIAVVSKVAAREQPKVYDDTELLLTIHEVKDQVERVQQAAQRDGANALEMARLMKELAQVTVDVKASMDQLAKDGVMAKNHEMMDGLTLVMKAIKKQTAAFANWAPAMEECLTGLKSVNTNVVSVGEEITSTQTAVIQALNAILQGKAGGTIKQKMVEVCAPMSLTGGLRRKHGLPSLSQMLEKKDQEKEESRAALPAAVTRLMEEAYELEDEIAAKKAKIRELEAQNKADGEQIEVLVADLTPEEREKVNNMRKGG